MSKLIESFVVNVKRQETPFYRTVHRLGKKLSRAEMPMPQSMAQGLYYLHKNALSLRSQLFRATYFQPLFRSRCVSCGENLSVLLALPYIEGDLQILIGDNCTINGRNAFIASRVFDNPTLTIGNNSQIGHQTEILVAKQVSIGDHVLIAEGCFIADNPGHPIEAHARRTRPVAKEQIKPVIIEDDVWIGAGSYILPGVRIGRGSVVGAGSVVTKDVPAFHVAAGNPAQVVKKIVEDKDDAGNLIKFVNTNQVP